MKSMSKKLFALMLCLALALSLSVAVSAEGALALDKSTLTLDLGGSYDLTASNVPEGKTVTWSSTDTTVASVSNKGKVQALKAGTADITAAVDGASVTCTVTVEAAFDLTVQTIMDDDYVDLPELLEWQVSDWAETFMEEPVVRFVGGISDSEFDFGTVNDDDYLFIEDEELPVTETFNCTMQIKEDEDNAWKSYTANITLKVWTTDVAESFDVKGGKLDDIADAIDNLLDVEYRKSLHHIYLEVEEMEGGKLYASSAMDAEIAEDVYDKSEMSALYYLPNGSGETSYLEYTAYGDEDENCEISGRIILKADEFMLLDYTISNQETLTLSAEDFEEAYLALSKAYASLDSVRFTSGISNGSAKGYFYVDYENEGDDADKVSNSTSKHYYTDPEGKEVGIDTITYVPGASTGNLVYTVTFKAHGFDEDGREVSKPNGKTGYLRITVVEAADLQITAGPGELTAIDPDFFQEFVAEKASTTAKKKYVVTRVVFSGVPASKEAGWLYTDGDEVTGSGSKTFYMDPKEGQMDLNDLYFLGGGKAGYKRVSFTVYGKAPTAKETARDSSVVSGTMDLIVGAPRKVQAVVKASQPMGMSSGLQLFKAMGNNENTYVIFRAQPATGGKLFYTDNNGVKTPIVPGEKYWLSIAGYGQKSLANVSFEASYSNSKITRTVTVQLIAGNAKGKEIEGTLEIAVQYAVNSDYFNDVKIGTNFNAQRYADSVDYLRVKGITTGNNAAGTTFGLTANITRGEFVTFLYRAAGRPSVVGLTNPFTDVSKAGQPYFYEAILWAAKENITTGRGNGIFDPNANVSYQEVLTFLNRYYVNYQKNPASTGTLYGFSDANQVAGWALPYAQWAAGKGIVDYYYDGGLLKPTTAATRGDVALFLHRMLTL